MARLGLEGVGSALGRGWGTRLERWNVGCGRCGTEGEGLVLRVPWSLLWLVLRVPWRLLRWLVLWLMLLLLLLVLLLRRLLDILGDDVERCYVRASRINRRCGLWRVLLLA